MKLILFFAVFLLPVNSAFGQVNFSKINSAWKTLKIQSRNVHPAVKSFARLLEDEIQIKLPQIWKRRLEKLTFDVNGNVLLNAQEGGHFSYKKSDSHFAFPNGISLERFGDKWAFRVKENGDNTIPFIEYKGDKIELSIQEIDKHIPYVSCHVDGKGARH